RNLGTPDGGLVDAEAALDFPERERLSVLDVAGVPGELELFGSDLERRRDLALQISEWIDWTPLALFQPRLPWRTRRENCDYVVENVAASMRPRSNPRSVT